MRKLVWCGAVVLVASAAAVYVAASHAAKHPDSYLGRCLRGAAYVGLHSNPFMAVTAPVVQQGQQMGRMTCEAMAQGAAAAVCPRKVHKPIHAAPVEQEPA